MTFRETKRSFLNELMRENRCVNLNELISLIGKTNIRCYWCDYVDYLAKDHQITEKQRQNWGQVI